MKTLRIEIFQDPPRERVLVDGVEVRGVTFEVAFLDAPSTSMTLHEFVTRVGKSSVAADEGNQPINPSTGGQELLPFVELRDRDNKEEKKAATETK